MRHVMLALMIVLLPLRGWAGDAMATEMAMDRAGVASMRTQPMANHDNAYGHAEATAHADHGEAAAHSAQTLHDCGGHDDQSHQAAPENTVADDDHCSTCGACQACHTVALSPAADRLNTLFGTPAMGDHLMASFTSASPAPGQKPPIS